MLVVQDESTPGARERAVAHFTHVKHGVTVHPDRKGKEKTRPNNCDILQYTISVSLNIENSKHPSWARRGCDPSAQGKGPSGRAPLQPHLRCAPRPHLAGAAETRRAAIAQEHRRKVSWSRTERRQ